MLKTESSSFHCCFRWDLKLIIPLNPIGAVLAAGIMLFGYLKHIVSVIGFITLFILPYLQSVEEKKKDCVAFTSVFVGCKVIQIFLFHPPSVQPTYMFHFKSQLTHYLQLGVFSFNLFSRSH